MDNHTITRTMLLWSRLANRISTITQDLRSNNSSISPRYRRLNKANLRTGDRLSSMRSTRSLLTSNRVFTSPRLRILVRTPRTGARHNSAHLTGSRLNSMRRSKLTRPTQERLHRSRVSPRLNSAISRRPAATIIRPVTRWIK